MHSWSLGSAPAELGFFIFLILAFCFLYFGKSQFRWSCPMKFQKAVFAMLQMRLLCWRTARWRCLWRQLVLRQSLSWGTRFGQHHIFHRLCKDLLVRSLVLGDAEAVWMLLHGCIVPSLNANFCSFGCIEVDESKLLASASHSIEENNTTQNEVSLLSWLFAFLIWLISLISQNNVELVDNLLLSAHRV